LILRSSKDSGEVVRLWRNRLHRLALSDALSATGPRTLPGFSLETPPPNPLRARYVSADGAVVVSVGVRRAADLRPTFLQTSDLSSWGPPDAVASLLVPPRSAVTSSTQFTENDSDGQAKTYYVYTFTARGSRSGALVAVAKKGFVVVALAVSASADASKLISLVETLRV
jgi:hypothetical protein